MIDPKDFIKALKRENIKFVTGVPDSLFKSLCLEFEKNPTGINHLTASNEGSSIGLAIGHYLSKKKPALVYLQNSGLGNTVNPLVSLADEKIYKIPIILLIGWRGEIDNNNFQIKDEPQHQKQGIITKKLLETLGINYLELNSKSNVNHVLKKIKKYVLKKSLPAAILVRKDTFRNNKVIKKIKKKYPLSREAALKILVKQIPNFIPKISTTGMLSRELNELNKNLKLKSSTFLTVGGMGHALSIASGIAIAKPNKKVLCLDGDGALLMHMGALTTSSNINNLIHVLFNNESHDSVGGQKTSSNKIDFVKVAKASGYFYAISVSKKLQIEKTIKKALKQKYNSFVEIKCNAGHRENLTRPNRSPSENKKLFMNFLDI